MAGKELEAFKLKFMKRQVMIEKKFEENITNKSKLDILKGVQDEFKKNELIL
jgi:hypothetical protein